MRMATGKSKRQSRKAKPKGKLCTLSIILNSAGKVNRAPSIARMDMNMSSKNSSPRRLFTPATVLVCPACNQNSPAAVPVHSLSALEAMRRCTDRQTLQQPTLNTESLSDNSDSRDSKQLRTCSR